MDDGLWRTEKRRGWGFMFLRSASGFERLTDVHVTSPGGRRWVGTVGTLKAIQDVMAVWQETGECLGGSYFWTADLLILRDGREPAVFDALEDLVVSGAHEDCFEEVVRGETDSSVAH